MKIFKTLWTFVLAHCISVASAATHVFWVGGERGDVFEESNWSPAHVPSSQNVTAYIAVFTNSVTIESTKQYWYPAGIVVSNNASVAYSNQRMKPTTACEGGVFTVDVEYGSSFKFGGTIVYGIPSLTLVKKGGGTLSATFWLGNANSSSDWKSIDVQQGILNFPARTGFTSVGDSVIIRSGAKAYVTEKDIFAKSETYGIYYPRVEIEEGAIFDLGGKDIAVSSLKGSGLITNCSGTATLNLRHVGDVFSGRIVGGGTVSVMPDAALTPANATWIVGDALALSGVDLMRNSAEGCDYSVLFASGIDTFYMKDIPKDYPCFNPDGEAVEIARAGNFWYVDCNCKSEVRDGKSLGTAFATLKEAMLNELLASNDTVFVASGVYSNELMEVTQEKGTVLSRVVVPSGVRLVSLGSATDTIIEGCTSPTPIDQGYGMGPGAARCAMLGTNAYLRGFTLRGGRTSAETTTSASSLVYGGGIFADPTAVIVDCVISNCVATRGGGAHEGNYFSCRFKDNRATGSPYVGAHLMNKARICNCVLDKGYSCHWYANKTDSLALNCTFAPNSDGAVRGLSSVSGQHVRVYNSLVLASPPNGSQDEYHTSIISPRGSIEGVSIAEDCTVTNLTASTTPTVYAFAGIDENFRPKSRRSRLVGKADLNAYKSFFSVEQYWLMDRDVDGKRRIYGESLDIGAFAFDQSRAAPGLRVLVK
jgi:hypothetical protein